MQHPSLRRGAFHDPLSFTDPTGHISLIGGINITTIPFIRGVTGNAGMYLNPGFGEDCFDFGGFYGVGDGWGYDASVGGFLGFVTDSALNIGGWARNFNFGGGPVGITVITNSGGFAGFTFNFGVEGIPVGFSVTETNTTIGGISNFRSDNCGCKK